MKAKNLLFLSLLILSLGLQAQVYQLPNPGFEQWDGTTLTGNSASEPTGWNTFGNADGSVATSWLTGSTAKQNHHAHRYGGRPGTSGSSYLTIWSKSALGIIANGNMTTGRIHIGSTTATDLTQNYNYTSRSASGFNQPFDGTPDSMYVWISFYAASASTQGSFSCYIHGDNDFKDPTDDSDASKYCCKASDQFYRTTTSSSSLVWQQRKVAFVHDGTSTANYIICTFNTNVTPAGGSAYDSLSVDDIQFIYSAWLSDILVDGQSLAGFSKSTYNYTVSGYRSDTFTGLNLQPQPEASDATITISEQPFQTLQEEGIDYTIHVVAEDGVMIKDYVIRCLVEQVGDPTPEYTITVLSADNNMGTVSGGGLYLQGATATLTATPAAYHHFTQWNDGVTMNPRSITVTGDSTFTASFAIDQHYVELYTSPSYFGSVSGAGAYAHGSVVTISATAPEHYHFSQWSDGVTDNPRQLTVTSDTLLYALFALDQHTLTLTANDPSMGSLTGAGTYNYGDSVLFSAQPNEHYHFVQWSDGVSDNPRVFQLLGDTAFTALFALDQHMVTCQASPEGAATFLGAGLHEWGETVTLEALPAAGFTYLQWQDGVTDNPRTLTVTSDTTLTALFSAQSFTLTANAQPAQGGSVSGAGSYTYGTQVSLEATAAEGYYFTMWSDSLTANPRTVTVTGNATYTALFAENALDPEDYLITTAVNNPLWGSVQGGGLYTEGTTATLTAVPAMNYHFDHWQDGDNHNPRTITVINNTTYTATFAPDQHTLTLSAWPTQGGTVGGAGSYAHASSAIIVATPATGYHFVQWSDGNTLNPRTLSVMSDTALMATFAINQYTLTTLSAHQAWGTVSGGGTYEHGQQATLTAQPAEGCHFTSWQDGNTLNPRTLTVTTDATYTASFAQNQYTLNLSAAPAMGGTVIGSGTYTHGATALLMAQPSEGYTFTMWSDSVTDNPRFITVTDNLMLTAHFTGTTHTVTVMSNVTDWGTVQGGGTYPDGATALLTALPAAGYRFVQWNDGETTNPRTLSVTDDLFFIATFASDQTFYTITALSCADEAGEVTGGGVYPEGERVQLEATAYDGWTFQQWNDGSKLNPRVITVSGDAVYIATFRSTNGIRQASISLSLSLYPNPTDGELRIESGEQGMKQIELIDMQGRLLLREQPLDAQFSILHLTPYPAGIYFLRVTTDTGSDTRRVVKQ